MASMCYVIACFLVLATVANASKCTDDARDCQHAVNKSSYSCHDTGVYQRCLLKLKPACSEDDWEEVVRIQKENKGTEYTKHSDIQTKCCDPVEQTLDKTCHGQAFYDNRGKINNTDSFCQYTQDLWNCSRPFSKIVMDSCEEKLYPYNYDLMNKNMIDQLNSCKKAGFKITVDYPAAGTVLQIHPFLTLLCMMFSGIVMSSSTFCF